MREALPLLSSYLYSEQVQLGAVDLRVGGEPDDEYAAFARLLRMRHAVACGLKLKPIVEAIERGTSQSSRIVKAEFKGAIHGRLDISLYLYRRGMNLSWPRTFPVLIAEATPDTPENQLVVGAIRQLIGRLNESDIQHASAEQTYCLNLLRWGRERLHTEPWERVLPVRSPARLRRETEHRIRKRQTGNEPAYSQFLAWYMHWSFDSSRAGLDRDEDFVSLLLAFPPGDFFCDRVFEIWCLQQVIESFRRCGAVILEGPRMLSQRSNQPICELKYDDCRIEIWFQKSLPSEKARWRYVHSRKVLAGIPDITVIRDDGRRLLIDAKRREARTLTRPEETYKMLGYFENFRTVFSNIPFWGALCFLSDNHLFTEVVTDGGHKVVLLGVHTDDPRICAFGGGMDTLVSEWLSLRTFGDGVALDTAPTMLM